MAGRTNACVLFGVSLVVMFAVVRAEAGDAGELARRACAAMRIEASARAEAPRAAFALSPICDAGRLRRTSAWWQRVAAVDSPDGTLVGRQRIAGNGAVALDIVSYASTGLVVGGLLCYPEDAKPHSTVIHVPGGGGGVFSGVAGDMVQTCIDWAALHGRTAFAPSLRGNDGSEGTPELCLGEVQDVIAAAVMLRSLEVVDADRLGLVGGSIGGCVALRAAPYIPNLRAVVAFVPPTSWRDLIAYHRTAWEPGVELSCSGEPRDWTIGGPEFADALEASICGHADCPDAEFMARSPLPLVSVQSAPTLVVAAESDNVVPLEQQVLWSLFRQSIGHPVSVISVDPCDPPGTPPLTTDVLLLARRSFHLLSPGAISSGMLFLMAHLDRAMPAGGP